MARAHGLLALAMHFWQLQLCEFTSKPHGLPKPNCEAHAGGWEAQATFGEPELSDFLNQNTQIP